MYDQWMEEVEEGNMVDHKLLVGKLHLLGWMRMLLSGWEATLVREVSLCVLMAACLPHFLWTVVYHKEVSLVPCSMCCSPVTSLIWSMTTL